MCLRSRVLHLVAFLCTSFAILPTASAHGLVTVQARTPEEIVSAILDANSSGRTTVIHVTPGDYLFTVTFDSTDGPSLLPPITGTVLLVGKKSDTTRFTTDASHGVFAPFINVRENGILKVQGISFIGAIGGDAAPVCDSPDELPSRCAHGGGAALNAGGLLWFEDSVLSGNQAFNFGFDAFGGAILSRAGHLHVDSTTVTGNTSTIRGGGIAVLGGTATLLNSAISGNKLSEGRARVGIQMYGFGLYVENAEVSIDHTTIAGNTNGGTNLEPDVFHGLGIFNGSGTVSITNSAIVENAEQLSFSSQHFAGAGGGIYNGGTMFIADSTVAGNAAGTFGGGIANFGKLTLQSVTVARNLVYGRYQDHAFLADSGAAYPPGCDFVFFSGRPPEFVGCFAGGGGIWTDPVAATTVLSTAVALNTLTGSPPQGTFGPDCGGATISNGYNAIGVATDCQLQRAGTSSPAASDQLGVDAELGDLTDDGEPGDAHVPLLSGSPLIDAGGKVLFACALRDQLGERRTDGDHDGRVECDVGAVEFQRDKKH
jgi:hypothetical protein